MRAPLVTLVLLAATSLVRTVATGDQSRCVVQIEPGDRLEVVIDAEGSTAELRALRLDRRDATTDTRSQLLEALERVEVSPLGEFELSPEPLAEYLANSLEH